MTQLETLRLQNLRNVPPGALSWLKELTELKELELIGIRLNDRDIESINQLHSLQSLLLWNIPTPSEPFVIDHLNGLTSLRAIRTNETLTANALLDLSKIETIEFIMDDTPLLADQELSALSKLDKLQTLFLTSPLITEASLPALAKMQSLRFLSVAPEVKLTADQLRDLGRKHLTRCKIISRRGDIIYHEPPPIPLTIPSAKYQLHVDNSRDPIDESHPIMASWHQGLAMGDDTNGTCSRLVYRSD